MSDPRKIYRVVYRRPWGTCAINTAQFSSELEVREGFSKSYKDCELLDVQDVTGEFQ